MYVLPRPLDPLPRAAQQHSHLTEGLLRQSASIERLTSLGVYHNCAPPALTAFRASSLRSTFHSATRVSMSGTLPSSAARKLAHRARWRKQAREGMGGKEGE